MQKKAATRDFNACNDRPRTVSGQSQKAPTIDSRVITFHFAGLSITSLTSLACMGSMRSKKPRQDYPDWKMEFRLFNFAGRCVRQQEKKHVSQVSNWVILVPRSAGVATRISNGRSLTFVLADSSSSSSSVHQHQHLVGESRSPSASVTFNCMIDGRFCMIDGRLECLVKMRYAIILRKKIFKIRKTKRRKIRQ